MQPTLEMQILARDQELLAQTKKVMDNQHLCHHEKIFWLRSRKAQLQRALIRMKGGEQSV